MIYAIDFGTSNSLIAGANPDGCLAPFEIAPKNDDPTILRSILYTPTKGEWVLGKAAIDLYTDQGAEGRLFRSIKKHLPNEGFNGTSVHGEYKTLHDLVAIFLKTMRERANEINGCDCDRVVLGRPALFSQKPKEDQVAEKRLRAAAMQAGFKEIHFCPEPVAAALSFKRTLEKEQIVFVADFGGGTSDFTVLKLSRDQFRTNDVLAINGLSVAGDKFDGAIMKHMISPHFGTQVKYKLPMGKVELSLPKQLIEKMCSPADMSLLAKADIVSLLRDAQKWSLSTEDAQRMNQLFILIEEHLGYKLFAEIERAKVQLSESTEAVFQFHHPEFQLEEQVFSSDFRMFSQSHVNRITHALDETLALAGTATDEVDMVCCTGGTAKIPALQYELVKRFGKNKLSQFKHFHSVVGGLSQQALDLY